MKMQCKETIEYCNTTELFKTSIKGLSNISVYFKQYLDKTKDYVEKIQSLNNKYKNSQKATTVDGCFQRLRLVINSQISSYGPLIHLIEKNIEDIESTITKFLECQKVLHKDYLDAESVFNAHSKDIDKVKRQYHSDAALLENTLRNFSKKHRNSKKPQDEEDNQDIQKAISNMSKSEKEYIRISSKGKTYMNCYIDSIGSATEGIQHLLQTIGNNSKEIIFCTMLSLQNSGKQISAEVTTFSVDMDKSLSNVVIADSNSNNNEENKAEPLQNLTYEPYTIKSLSKESQDDFTEAELHNIIKTIAKNMIKKPEEYDVKLQDEKILFNGLVTKMLTFTSNDFCSPKEMKYIERLVQTHLFRSIFIHRLNNLRVSGTFSLPQEHYVEIGKVIAMILNAVEQENDLETAKNVIILSQTYYFKNDEEKIYLHRFIRSHPLFESKAFWEEFMLDSIQKELDHNRQIDAKLKQNMNESKENYKLKISNIALSQLAPIADNMLELNIPKEDIIKLLESVLVKYPINSYQRKMIFSVVENPLESVTKKKSDNGTIIVEDVKEIQDNNGNKKEIEPLSNNDGGNNNLLKEDDKKNEDHELDEGIMSKSIKANIDISENSNGEAKKQDLP